MNYSNLHILPIPTVINGLDLSSYQMLFGAFTTYIYMLPNWCMLVLQMSDELPYQQHKWICLKNFPKAIQA